MNLPGPHPDLPKCLTRVMSEARVVIQEHVLPTPHLLVLLARNRLQSCLIDVLHEIQRHVKEIVLYGVLLIGFLLLLHLRVLLGIRLILLHYLLNLLAQFVIIELRYVRVLHFLRRHRILPTVENVPVQSGPQRPSVKVRDYYLSLKAQISRGLLGQPSIPSLQFLLLLFLIICLSVSLCAQVRLHLGLNVLLDQVVDVQVVVCLCLVRAGHLGDTLILEEQVLQNIIEDGLGVLGLDICDISLLSQDHGPRWNTMSVVDGMHTGSSSFATL